MGKSVFGSRPPEATSPLEQAGDRLWRDGGRASDPQPAGRQSVPGSWSSLAQDPALENG